MKTKIKMYVGSAAILLLAVGAGCAANTTPEQPVSTSTYPTTSPSTSEPTPSPSSTPTPTTSATSTVVENIAHTNNLLVFGAALQDANIVSLLQGQGQFTVFAPTDDAFNKVPSSTVQMMLGDKNRQNLSNLLKYHIANGNYSLDQLLSMKNIPTLNGQNLQIRSSGGVVTVNGIPIDPNGIVSKNGIIYPIQGVLYPTNFRGAPTSSRE